MLVRGWEGNFCCCGGWDAFLGAGVGPDAVEDVLRECRVLFFCFFENLVFFFAADSEDDVVEPVWVLGSLGFTRHLVLLVS